jgi:hypothetical protein
VSIADRYLFALGDENYPNLILLATISLLMAAKLDEHLKPNFKRMSGLIEEK